jgi:hypothetical protein
LSIGTGVLGLLQRPGPPGVLLILAFVLMYFVRPWLDRKAQQPFGRRPARQPPPRVRPQPEDRRSEDPPASS